MFLILLFPLVARAYSSRSELHLSSRVLAECLRSPSIVLMMVSRSSTNAISASTIQNSLRCLRVLPLSALKAGLKVYTREIPLQIACKKIIEVSTSFDLKEKLDLAFNNVKPKDWYFVFDLVQLRTGLECVRLTNQISSP